MGISIYLLMVMKIADNSGINLMGVPDVLLEKISHQPGCGEEKIRPKAGGLSFLICQRGPKGLII